MQQGQPCAVGLKTGTKLPDLHSIHHVEILNAFHDGIFVRIPDYEADGLIHHSQISRNLVLSPEIPKVDRYRKIEELVGDIDYEVYVKVVYVADQPDHLKCECSLKMVRCQPAFKRFGCTFWGTSRDALPLIADNLS
jgi:predicted RNA-binding protein with RPS1 domain